MDSAIRRDYGNGGEALKGPWVKLWRKMLTDEKLQVLIEDHGDKAFRVWVTLLARAEDGIISESRRILSSITQSKPAILEKILADMKSLEMIELDDTQIVICKWNEYQDSESKDRVRRLRERNMSVTSPLHDANVTGILQKDRRIEDREENTKSAESAECEQFENSEQLPEPIVDSPKSKKEPKHEYGSEKNVNLTDKQYQSLVTDLGLTMATACIEELSTRKAMKGYSYKRDDLAIRNWVIEAVKKKEVKPGGILEQRPDAWTPDRIAEQRKAIEDRGTEPDIDFREAVKTDPFVAALLRG
jgi:N-terminal phage replisome organiser (Phage_rep_org_N)